MKRLYFLMTTALFCATINATTVENEPNNDYQHAQWVDVNTTVSASLGFELNDATDEDDFFVIQLPDDGELAITTCSDASLRLGRMHVSSQKGNEFIERANRDMDGYSEDGRKETLVINDAKAGTYYIRNVRYRGEGNYTISFQFTASPFTNDSEPNDEIDMARRIDCGRDYQGRLGFYYDNSDKDLHDWYCIEIPADGTLNISTTTETTLRLDRLHLGTVKDGEFVSRNSEDMDAYNRDTTIVFSIPNIAKGIYYFHLAQYRGYGGYVLNCQFTPNPYACDEEPDDEIAMAQSVACGRDIQGHLGYYYTDSSDMDSYDWYRIDIPADGTLNISTTTETTLRLSQLYIGTMEDGEFISRSGKDMDAYNRDTTIVFNIPDLAKGTYYISVKHYRGYGGYILRCAFTGNPYYTDDIVYTEDDPCRLTVDKTRHSTLGYRSQEVRNEMWYSFSTSGPTTLEIQPDTTKTLVIGVVEVWRKNADGSRKSIFSERLERTYRSFEISEAGEYLVRIPRYSGYGGIAVRYGSDESGAVVPGSAIRVSVEGRNTVRKGVPCQNTVVVRNTSDRKTGSFFVAIANTDDIHINKINLSDIDGRYGEDMMYDDICNSDSSIVLFIPSLAPLEEYRILVTSEGVGDINYAIGRNRVGFALTGTVLVAAAIGFAADACMDAAGDWLKGKVKESVGELSESEAEAYSRCMGMTRQQYEDTKYSADGYGACVAKKAIENTMQGVMKAVPGGSTAMKIGEKVAESADIITCMRRKLWYWIYKDIGLIPSDNSTQVYDAKVGINGVVASWDPNEMIGPNGTGTEHFIGDVKTIDYTIMFENKAEAGAPAYRIRIFDELDPEIFDVSSVRFGSTSHDGLGYNWKISRDGGRLTWDIEGIELPPNKVAPEGEGYVTFSVDLKPGLSDGTVISNKATIIFDKNTPIETNVFSNVLDLEAPVTTMLSAENSDDCILLKCRAKDNKSGAATYALYVSKDNGDYSLAGLYQDENIRFTPNGDGEYRFYVLTTDNAGNAETTIPSPVSITTDVTLIPVDTFPSDTDFYDLSGRKIKNPTPGIYIRNGRKVLM